MPDASPSRTTGLEPHPGRKTPNPAPGGGDAAVSAGDVGALWDQRFTEATWPEQPDAAVVELVSPVPAGRALDLGSGPGRNAIWLARHGWQVTAVDASAVGLAQARQRAAVAGVELETVVADLLVLEPARASFDLVLMANLHVAPADRPGLFARAAAAVAPGGHLLVVGHHLDSLGRVGPPDPERLFTEQLLVSLVPTLEVELVRREVRPLAEQPEPAVDVVLWARAPRGEQ
jgi:SAM-dependent methyltransferase